MTRARAVATVSGVLLLVQTSCAALWGFEPLQGSEGDDAGGSSDGARDANGSALDAQGDAQRSDAAPGADAQGEGGAQGGDSAAGGDGSVHLPGLECESAGGACTCAVNTPSNGAPCSAAVLGVDPSTVLCCADPSYPSNGECTCQWIGCTTYSGLDNCLCGPLANSPGGSCAAASWTCCIQTSAPGCVCAAQACQAGYETVGNTCAISQMKCGGGRKLVAACN